MFTFLENELRIHTAIGQEGFKPLGSVCLLFRSALGLLPGGQEFLGSEKDGFPLEVAGRLRGYCTIRGGDVDIYEAVGEAVMPGGEIALEPDEVATVKIIGVGDDYPDHTGGVLLADTAEDAEVGGEVLVFVEVGDAEDGYVVVCCHFRERTQKTSNFYIVVGVGLAHIGGIGINDYELGIWAVPYHIVQET